jgi:hypothetical protein
MDPNACLYRILEGLDHADADEFECAMEDLYEWLRNGGFPPDTSDLGTHRVAVGFPGMRRNDAPMYRTEPRTLIICRTSWGEIHLHKTGLDAFAYGTRVFSREW